MSCPKVSAFMATYGKPAPILAEAVACFLAQDYCGEKELVILNDTPGVQFTCSAPGVRVFNHPDHIWPLGKKFNQTAQLATGEILWVFEDDDLNLPHAISFAVANMGDAPFFHTRRALWTPSPGTYQRAENLHHGALFIRREYFWERGGYIAELGADADQGLWRTHAIASAPTEWADTYYCYRWAGLQVHVSCGKYEPRVAPGTYEIVPPDLSPTFAAMYRVTGRAV